MDTICIEYEFTKNDLIIAYENDLKKSKLQGCLLSYLAFNLTAVIFGAILIFLYYLDAPAPILILSIIAWPVAGVLLILFFNRRRRASRILRGRLRRGEIELQYFGRHRLELSEDGIELRYGTICVQRAYAGIQNTVEYPGGIMIYGSQLDREIIPSTAFGDAQQRGAFLNQLQARISQAKNVGISNQSVEEQKRDTKYILEYTWDEPDFISAMTRASRLMYTTRLGWSTGQIICTLIGIMLCFAGIGNMIQVFTAAREFQQFKVLPGAYCFGIAFFLLVKLIIVFTPWVKKQYRQQIDNGVIPRDYFGTQALCFKEDRITEVRRLNSFDIMYGNIYCVKQDANGMYLLMKGNRAFVIPNSAFSADDQKEEIVNYIESKIKRSLR